VDERPDPTEGRSLPRRKDRRGRFQLKRITDSKRSRAKLRALRGELLRRRDRPVPEQGRWLASVLRGHANYYGVPGNQRALYAFRSEVVRLWRRALRRRSQRTRMTWARMQRLRNRWLPSLKITHPWPTARFDARTQGRSPVR
jgi:RNA-directed DNA polymerase